MLASLHKSSQMVLTLLVLALALISMWIVYQIYFEQAWTRDAQVNAIVVKIAPRVSGPVMALNMSDNQLVKKGDLLFTVDPATYQIAFDQAKANLDVVLANSKELALEAQRREKIQKVLSVEEVSKAASDDKAGQAEEEASKAALEAARLNLKYTEVRAPVDGYVTNLTLGEGTFVSADQAVLALIDKNSFWVTGFFKETQIAKISVGASAIVTLMGDKKHPLKAKVTSIGWGINRTDIAVTSNNDLLLAVTPTFDWVRLAQRIPVHLKLETTPQTLPLVMGMTASVTVLP